MQWNPKPSPPLLDYRLGHAPRSTGPLVLVLFLVIGVCAGAYMVLYRWMPELAEALCYFYLLLWPVACFLPALGGTVATVAAFRRNTTHRRLAIVTAVVCCMVAAYGIMKVMNVIHEFTLGWKFGVPGP
jgi:hypothetical protein